MTDYLATCPVHGEGVEAHNLASHGWLCMADDPDRPEGICARECEDLVFIETGYRLGGRKAPPPWWAGEEFSKTLRAKI